MTTMQHSDLEDVLKENFAKFASYFIKQRAVPDVRDGLKPVHRRLLYTAYELGARPGHRHMKSAEVSNTAMGRYHPHGDAYGTLARMAQWFAMRYPLIDGQGNFGSIDGDSPAAARYTECRLTKIAEELFFNDLNEDVVLWQPNYADNRREPTVLPAELPHVLMNGTSGIAVGLATEILPFNGRELLDCLFLELDSGTLGSLDDPPPMFTGPDFPTGGLLEKNIVSLKEAWLNGKGSFKLRGTAKVETDEQSGRKQVIITGVPWIVDKSELLTNIAKLVTEKDDEGKREIEGITDVRDSSKGEDIRVVIDISARTDPQVVLNLLYQKTRLQDSFSCNFIVIDGDKPCRLGVRQILLRWLDFRRECVRNALQREQRQLHERLEVVDALLTVHAQLDSVIKTIKESEDPRVALQQKFKMNERQAESVVRLPLGRLRKLDQKELTDEKKKLQDRDAEVTKTLADPKLIDALIRQRLVWWREQLDDRRTQVVDEFGKIQLLDTVTREDVVLSVNNKDEMRVTRLNDYRKTHRGASGVKEAYGDEEDAPRFLVKVTTHDSLFVFTNKGKCHDLLGHELPIVRRAGKTVGLREMFPESEPDEKIVQVLSFDLDTLSKEATVIMLRSDGEIKRLDVQSLIHKRGNVCTCFPLETNTELIAVTLAMPDQDAAVFTKKGDCRRFPVDRNLRVTSNRFCGGVHTATPKDDTLLRLTVMKDDDTLVTVTSKGFGARILGKNIVRKKGRCCGGNKLVRCDDTTGELVFADVARPGDELLLTTSGLLTVRFSVNDVREVGRGSKGVRLQRLDENETVVAAALIPTTEM